jgi:Zinc finger, C2H2 type
MNYGHNMKIKRFYCSTEGCGKSFRSEEQLKTHLVVHSVQEESSEDTYRFQCEICNSNFPTKRSVSAHKRVHKSPEKCLPLKSIINLLTRRLREIDTDTKLQSISTPTENITIPIIKPTEIKPLPPVSSLIKNDNY